MSKQSLIEAAFFGALEKETAEERAAFLEAACAGDAEVRLQVDKMLKAHLHVGDFLQQPAVEQLPSTPALPEATRFLDPSSDAAAVGTSPQKSLAGEKTDIEESILAFLTPSTRPDSLGRIGHYEVLQVLGHGGFGIVFRAFDETLQRVVAVKVLSPQLAVTSPARKRFLREARSSARVRHQNIVQVYSVEEQPLPYLVMEYIPGETLQQRIDRTGPFDLDEVVQIGRQIAEGLAAAHAQGLIHRDIKPANILIENGVDPCVKITDFGLARTADDASLTQSGAIAGTPMFMAPEQARGESLDQRADLFSLGSVLYNICSGRPPFRAPSTVAVLKRVVEDTPRPIPEIIPEVPQWLCDIITRLHAKRPEDRIATAREVADLLALGAAAIQQPVRFPVIVEEGAPAADKTLREDEGIAEPTLISASLPALRPRSRPPRWAVAAVLLLLCVAGLGFAEGTGVTNFRGTVVRLFSPEGTLVVEVDDPEVSVQIDGADMVITGAGVKEIRLKAGQHTVETRKDGKLVSRELTTVTKNGRQVVRISQEPPSGMQAASKGGKEPDSKTPPGEISAPSIANDPDRRAAEYVLSIGGAIRVNEQAEFIEAVANLPPGPLRLTTIHLISHPQLTDADLAHFKNCKSLMDVRLSGASLVGDKGMAYLKDCKNLVGIGLENTNVSDEGLAHFANLKNLRLLGLSDTPVSDAGLAHFEDCKELVFLALNGTQISDAGLAHFKDCKNLMKLDLANTKVSDAGLAHFKDCNRLTLLLLSGTQVTDAGLAYFQDCTLLTHLHLADMKVGDAGLAHLKGCQNLETIDLQRTQVSDAGLVHLKGFQKLISVNLRETQVTAQGIADLQKALPGCQIASETDPDRSAAEYVLSVGGGVQVQVNQQYEFIDSSTKLPPKPFQLITVHLFSNSRPTDAGLAQFKDCKNLQEVRLNGCEQVSDTGISHLKDCKNLQALGLDGTKVTDNGLASFKDFKSLVHLSLSDTQIGDAGLASFSGCKDLRILALNNLRISDAGLASFQGCQNLMSLILINTKVGDDGLAHFKDCKNLTSLSLNGTNVTDLGLAYFKDCKVLTHLNLPDTKVTDAGLVHLKSLKNLKTLDLKKTQVTAQGIAELKQALPDCKIEWEPQVALWPADAPPPAIAPFDAKQARQHQEAWAKYLGVPVEYTDSIEMKFVLIPPGIFLMGSPRDEAGRHRIYDESQHRVTLTKAFYLGAYEVTQKEWQSVMGKNPSSFKEDARQPVEQISWNDTQEFTKALRDTTQQMYRLPSEAEWEYACRAGTTTPFHFGEMISINQANFSANKGGHEETSDADRRKPMRVGSFPPNAYGLYDMHGNVYEFCADSLDDYARQDLIDPVGPEHKHGRVMRGGTFNHLPSTCRSAVRETLSLDRGFHDIGVRLALSVDSVKRQPEEPVR